MKKKKSLEICVILDNLRSVYNTASIFRICDCAGIREVYLCGTTPPPVDRFSRKRNDFKKVSLGAEDTIKWFYFKDTRRALFLLKKKGFEIVAVEQDGASINYADYSKAIRSEKIALIFGEEVSGIKKTLLKNVDKIVEIPIYGKKESLNVAITAGIVIFDLIKN